MFLCLSQNGNELRSTFLLFLSSCGSVASAIFWHLTNQTKWLIGSFFATERDCALFATRSLPARFKQTVCPHWPILAALICLDARAIRFKVVRIRKMVRRVWLSASCYVHLAFTEWFSCRLFNRCYLLQESIWGHALALSLFPLSPPIFSNVNQVEMYCSGSLLPIDFWVHEFCHEMGSQSHFWSFIQFLVVRAFYSKY